MKRRLLPLLLVLSLLLVSSPWALADWSAQNLTGGVYALSVSGAERVAEEEYWVAQLDPQTGEPTYVKQTFTVIYLPDAGATLDLSCYQGADDPSAWGSYTVSTVLNNGALYVTRNGSSGPSWSSLPVKGEDAPLFQTYSYPDFTFSLVFASDASKLVPASRMPQGPEAPTPEDRVTYSRSPYEVTEDELGRLFTCSQAPLGVSQLEVGRFSYENSDPFLSYTATEITQATLFFFPAGTTLTPVIPPAVTSATAMVTPFDKSGRPVMASSYTVTEPGVVYLYEFNTGSGQSHHLYFTAAGPQGLDTPIVVLPFSDRGQAVDKWALAEVNAAIAADLSPRQFDYMDLRVDMTRAQFAAVAVTLYEAASGQEAPQGEDPFTDTDDPFVLKAYALGITTGTSATTFTPDGPLTREQAAVMLSRVYSLLGGTIPQVMSTGFTDDAQISSWARSSVAFMAQQGILNGVGGGRFAPQSHTQLQVALLLSLRLYNARPSMG